MNGSAVITPEEQRDLEARARDAFPSRSLHMIMADVGPLYQTLRDAKQSHEDAVESALSAVGNSACL